LQGFVGATDLIRARYSNVCIVVAYYLSHSGVLGS